MTPRRLAGSLTVLLVLAAATVPGAVGAQTSPTSSTLTLAEPPGVARGGT
jgi:hypothetical protein